MLGAKFPPITCTADRRLATHFNDAQHLLLSRHPLHDVDVQLLTQRLWFEDDHIITDGQDCHG